MENCGSLPGDGVSVIDPRHLPFNKLPPPVHIEQITADRKTLRRPSSNLRLPPLSSRSGDRLYRSQPGRAGEDPFSRQAGRPRSRLAGRRQSNGKAFYTDLPPRNYRFRVIASNNSGVWNEAGDSFDFSIAPAYYQTTWFQASCVAAFLALLWALYRYRLHQIAQEFNARLEERVGERTRIARELHDTLLQSLSRLAVPISGGSQPASPAARRSNSSSR